VILPLALTLAALPMLALASQRDVRDDNDVKGRLDLRKVSLYGRPRVWNLKTYDGWSSRSIWDHGYLLVQLDTIGGQRFDYHALVSSNGRSMEGVLFRDRAKKADYRVARLAAWRLNRRGVKVRIPLGKTNIGERRGFFRWQIRSLFTGRGCRRSCIDVAPLGPVKQPLRPPQASPTLSSSSPN
jgi:hypothetical protein